MVKEKKSKTAGMPPLSKEAEYYVLKRLQESPDRNWMLMRDGRTLLTMVVSVLHFLLVVLAIIMLSLSLFCKLYVETKVDLFDGLDISSTMAFLIALFVFLILLHGFATGFFQRLKSCTEINKNWFIGFKIYLAVVCILLLVVIIGTFSCFMLSNRIEKQLHHSIFGAMKQYKTNPQIKTRIDMMQQKYHCCGGISAHDWSSVSWISNSFLNINSKQVKIKMEKNEYFPNGVPFSCCSVNAKPPCIHINSDFSKDMNVYKRGCSQRLLDYFEIVYLLPVGILLVVTAMTEIAILIFTRILQTSLKSAHLLGDDNGVGYAHLMPERFQDIWYDDYY